MRRKYKDCLRLDGNCTRCDMVTNGMDCRGRPITKLEWHRMAANLGQKELAEKSGVQSRLIQNVELMKSEAGNMTAKNLLALANALGVKADDLI